MYAMSLRERSWQLQKAFMPAMSMRERLLRLRLAANLTTVRVRVPHTTLVVDVRDLGVGRNIYRHHAYEPQETRLLQDLTPKGGVVLDIGANLGYYTTLFAQTAGHVYAAEPNPETVALLRANTAAMPNVTIWPCLVGNEDRDAALYLSPIGNAGDDHAIPSADRQSVPVPMASIDSLAAALGITKVDLIKLDIQGYEVFAVRGMQRVLAENPDAVIVAEFWPLGLQRAGLTVNDWLTAFGPNATFWRSGPRGQRTGMPHVWFHEQPIEFFESFVIYRH